MLFDDALAEKVVPEVSDVSRDIDLDEFEFMPYEGRFLVETFSPDKVSRGGIVLPDIAQEVKNWGRVVTLPEGKAPPGINVGDIVLFADSAGIAVESLGDNFRLLDYRDDFENDVLGVFRPKLEAKKEPLDKEVESGEK